MRDRIANGDEWHECAVAVTHRGDAVLQLGLRGFDDDIEEPIFVAHHRFAIVVQRQVDVGVTVWRRTDVDCVIVAPQRVAIGRAARTTIQSSVGSHEFLFPKSSFRMLCVPRMTRKFPTEQTCGRVLLFRSPHPPIRTWPV